MITVSDASRRTCQYGCPWLQCRSLRAKAHDLRHREDQITVHPPSAPILFYGPQTRKWGSNLLNATLLQSPPILQSPDSQLPRIRNSGSRCKDRTNRTRTIKTLRVTPLCLRKLALAGGDVVCCRIAKNIIYCFGFENVLCGTTDHDGEFGLVVTAIFTSCAFGDD